ncbi:hypothetical protein EGT07_22645 [Herbaspirillum sp. HC18]|nr:hypothetical protein EGT07_22645 [Herbaspirillum sp. HC18]
MDYKKLDAALAAALTGVQGTDEKLLEVFVYVSDSLGEDEKDILAKLGVNTGGAGTILTARLSAREIEDLSCRTSIKYMKLSQRLRPL